MARSSTASTSYAAARAWTVAEEFVDRGVSGSLASRPALDRLRAAARRRDVDAVVVWRFDRFSRSITDLVASLEEFRTLGVAFISIREQNDTGSPTGRVVFAVVAAMAEFEREILRERVRAGMARVRERGVRLGRPLKLDVVEILRLRHEGLPAPPTAGSIPSSRQWRTWLFRVDYRETTVTPSRWRALLASNALRSTIAQNVSDHRN